MLNYNFNKQYLKKYGLKKINQNNLIEQIIYMTWSPVPVAEQSRTMGEDDGIWKVIIAWLKINPVIKLWG